MQLTSPSSVDQSASPAAEAEEKDEGVRERETAACWFCSEAGNSREAEPILAAMEFTDRTSLSRSRTDVSTLIPVNVCNVFSSLSSLACKLSKSRDWAVGGFNPSLFVAGTFLVDSPLGDFLTTAFRIFWPPEVEYTQDAISGRERQLLHVG